MQSHNNSMNQLDYPHNGGWIYSAARSRRLGIDHSPLVELSGVVGGMDPIVGVIPDETGNTRLFIEAGVVALVVIYGETPLGPDRAWELNAAASFSNARSVFVNGFAHWDCGSAATDAGTGSVALTAAGFAAVVFVVPGMVLKVVRSAGGICVISGASPTAEAWHDS